MPPTMVYCTLLNGQSPSVYVIFPTSVSIGLFSNTLKVNDIVVPIGLNSFIRFTLNMILMIAMEKEFRRVNRTIICPLLIASSKQRYTIYFMCRFHKHIYVLLVNYLLLVLEYLKLSLAQKYFIDKFVILSNVE